MIRTFDWALKEESGAIIQQLLDIGFIGEYFLAPYQFNFRGNTVTINGDDPKNIPAEVTRETLLKLLNGQYDNLDGRTLL